MTLYLKPLVGLVMSAAIIAGSALSAQEYTLPKQSNAAVITIDYQSDRLKRIDDSPTMSILADGSVILPQSYSHTRAYRGKISETELQELLAFVIEQNHFFDFEAEQVKAKLNKIKRQPLPVHYSTTVINVNADNRNKEVKLAALGKGAMVDETQKMLAIKQRLNKLMATVKLGGASGVKGLLDIANSNLRLKSSSKFREANRKEIDAGFFTADDLERGGTRADGSLSARFNSSNGASVMIDIDSNGKRLITVATDNK